MPPELTLDELNISAFMSSKLCHDLVGPVGAINNGLELLEDDDDDDTRAYAFEIIQNSARIAALRLEFARLAFGSSSGLGGEIELGHAEKIARHFVEEGKHRLNWPRPEGALPKDHVRLLLIALCISLQATPGGGEIAVSVRKGLKTPSFFIRCKGKTARMPENFEALLNGMAAKEVDPRNIMPYYAGRLAIALGAALTARKDGADMVFECAPSRKA
ncbi:MAG: histidine phosphotransferase family protein [Hyphomicrobiales bacterium]|nr:histidine phosphotransferase family protein [Hyphomicrobiales bacterium]